MGAPYSFPQDLERSARVARCLTVDQLHAISATEYIDAIVYVSGESAAPSASAFARFAAGNDPPTPILMRTALSPHLAAELSALGRAGLDCRASLIGADDFDLDLMRFVRSLLIPSATTSILAALMPSIPSRCRSYGLAALLLGAKRRTVGALRNAFDVSDRVFRMRYEEIGLPAHRVLALSLACHGLTLLESGRCNVSQAAALLDFEEPNAFSECVHHATGYRPLSLRRRTSSAMLIASFRDALLAGQERNRRSRLNR
jgi:hypothetical protein